SQDGDPSPKKLPELQDAARGQNRRRSHESHPHLRTQPAQPVRISDGPPATRPCRAESPDELAALEFSTSHRGSGQRMTRQLSCARPWGTAEIQPGSAFCRYTCSPEQHQQGVKERTWDQLCEQRPEGSHRDDSIVSHPQLNGVLDKKVQG